MTSCRDCIFSVYKKNKQTHCEMDKLYQFHEQGVEIIEDGDSELEYYVMPNKTCYYHRTQDWADRYKDKDLVEVVNIENQIHYHVILWDNDTINLVHMIQQLATQISKPHYISVILRHETKYSLDEIKQELKKIDCKWSVHENYYALTDDVYHSIKNVLNRIVVPYVALGFHSVTLSNGFFQTVADRIKDEQLQFHYLSTGGNALIILPTKLLKFVISNDKGNFLNCIVDNQCFTANII